MYTLNQLTRKEKASIKVYIEVNSQRKQKKFLL